MIRRRGFIAGLLFAPAIIRTPGLLMPVKAERRPMIVRVSTFGRFLVAGDTLSLRRADDGIWDVYLVTEATGPGGTARAIPIRDKHAAMMAAFTI